MSEWLRMCVCVGVCLSRSECVVDVQSVAVTKAGKRKKRKASEKASKQAKDTQRKKNRDRHTPARGG